MIHRKRAYRHLIVLITFLLGVVFQLLLAQWLPTEDVSFVALMIIIISLVLRLAIAADSLTVMENVTELVTRSGIRAEYIEDDDNGLSYQRSKELVRKMKRRITIVSPWENSSEYQDSISFREFRNSRSEYYDELIKQIHAHTNIEFFHRRIIQTKRESKDEPLHFQTDPTFYNYLKHAAETQQKYPLSCRLRRAPMSLSIHFTIIDDRFVIIPIFTVRENHQLARQSVLIFDDKQGDVVKRLNDIYEQ